MTLSIYLFNLMLLREPFEVNLFFNLTVEMKEVVKGQRR